MPYTESYDILGNDCDLNDMLRPSKVLRYMQETANRQMSACGPSYNDLFKRGLAFILSRITVVYYDQLHPYDKISVETWPSESKSLVFPRFYRIIRDNKTVMEGASSWALVNIENRTLVRATEIDLSNYQFTEPLELPLRFKIPSELKFEECKAHTVEYSQIDCNRHMNNTNYPDMLCNRIPEIEAKEIKSFSINFLSDAPFKETVKVLRYDAENENGESTYYFKTLKVDVTNVEAKVVTKAINS